MQPEESVFRAPRPGGSLEFLQRQAGDGEPFRILSFEPRRSPFGGVLPPSTAAVYGLEDALGFDSLNLAAYAELMRALDPEIVVKRGNFRGVTRVDALASPLVDLLNVRWVLAASPQELPGLHRAHVSDLAVHENPGALPRAFLVGEVRVEPDPDERLRAMAHPGFRPDLWAYSEVPIEGPEPGATDRLPDPGIARLARHEDERVEVDVEAARPGLLVLTDAWYPGWKAYVDGQERPIHRVDHVFRGVVVRPGDRRVVFEYHPASFRVGAAASLGGLLVLGIGSFALARTGRARRPAVHTETA